MSIKLVALDLDGTLLNEKKQVSLRTRQILEECEKKNIQIVPATGRALHAVPREILTLPGVRYGVFTNGASVWDIKEGKSIAEGCMDWRTAADTAKLLRAYPLIYDMYIGGQGVCERRFMDELEGFGLSEEHCRFIRSTRQPVEDMTAYLAGKQCAVQKMNLTFRDREVKAEVRRRLEGLPGVLVTSSLPDNLEVNAAGITKGSGLACLRRHLGLRREETMACGDGENDLPMLEAAGIGAAMANGASFVKEQADYITLSNEEDGVAAAIERWAL